MASDDVLVIIPFQGNDPHRLAALDFVARRWVETSFGMLVGALHPDEPWSKARAVATALDPDFDGILIVADADVWCDDIEAAVRAVRMGSPWAIPHRRVFRLNEAATDRVINHGIPFTGLSRYSYEPPYNGIPGGGCVVLRADTYRQVPLDPRFTGWGQEDVAWGQALTQIAGWPWRSGRHLYHLWHPAPTRLSRGVGSAEGLALQRRYQLARGSNILMNAVLDEFREVPAPSE